MAGPFNLKASTNTQSSIATAGKSILRRRSLVDLAHEEIQKRITDGVLAVDERLVIDALAREFGTSLIPIREALARLHAERLVTFEANKGYRVAPAPEVSELKQLFDARLILELGALERVTPDVIPSVVAELETINDRIAKGRYGKTFSGYVDFVKLNAEFHSAIVRISQNDFIVEAYDRLGYHQRILRTLHGRGVPDIRQIVAEHAAIIAALKRTSVEETRAALKAHILDAAGRLDAAPTTGLPR